MSQQLSFNGSSGQVLLHLPESKYQKRLSIGFLKNRYLIINKTRSKHYLRMYQGFSFNYDLIAYHSVSFDIIDLVVDGKHLYSTPQVIMSKGKMLNYDELQICLPEKYFCSTVSRAIEQYRELEREQVIDFKPVRDTSQCSLFAEAV